MIFGARLKSCKDSIFKVAIVYILDIDDGVLLVEEWWELAELQAGERDILYNLETSLDDVVRTSPERLRLNLTCSGE